MNHAPYLKGLLLKDSVFVIHVKCNRDFNSYVFDGYWSLSNKKAIPLINLIGIEIEIILDIYVLLVCRYV